MDLVEHVFKVIKEAGKAGLPINKLSYIERDSALILLQYGRIEMVRVEGKPLHIKVRY